MIEENLKFTKNVYKNETMYRLLQHRGVNENDILNMLLSTPTKKKRKD